MKGHVQNTKRYSVLTFNFGGHEVLREVQHKSPNAEYIYVTDDRSITSRTWDVRYVDNPYPEDVFYACWQVRYNPFDFATTDIVLKIDGSIEVLDKTDEIIDYFDKDGGYDVCLLIHSLRYSVREEYDEWCNTRGYSRHQANRAMDYMAERGYDVCGYHGLYQTGLMIQRRNSLNHQLNQAIFSATKDLAEAGKQVDRLDQTIGSFIINTQFENSLKVMAVDERIVHSKYFRWYRHGTWEECRYYGKGIKPYLFNRPVRIAKLSYHARAIFGRWWLPLPVVTLFLFLNHCKKRALSYGR